MAAVEWVATTGAATTDRLGHEELKMQRPAGFLPRAFLMPDWLDRWPRPGWRRHGPPAYMPMPCGPGAADSFSSFGRSATIASVVSMSEATLEAFCRAKRDTLVGSITPACSRSSYWPVAALKPYAPWPSLTLFTTMLPSQPPFCAIQRMGSSSDLRMMSTPNFSPSSTFSESSTLEARR